MIRRWAFRKVYPAGLRLIVSELVGTSALAYV